MVPPGPYVLQVKVLPLEAACERWPHRPRGRMPLHVHVHTSEGVYRFGAFIHSDT